MSYKSLCALFALLLLPATLSFADQPHDRNRSIIIPDDMDFDKFSVEIAAARDYMAPANLYVPKGRYGQQFPAMLLQFGAQGDKDVDYIVEIAEGMAKRGFVVMVMDMPGRGSRADTSPEPQGNEDLVRWYMEDYKTGVDYLESHPAVIKSKLSYAGTSLGAITGIPFCAKDQRIKTCISIVGGGSTNSGLPAELDCVKMVSEISPRATMLVNGTLDFVIPVFMAQNLHSRVKQPAEKIWYQADHYLQNINREGLYDRMARFILGQQTQQ